jgi:hypothetical protein
MTKLKHT